MEEEVIKKYHTNFRIKTIPIILIILLIIVLINMSSDKKIPKEEIQLYVIENIYLLNEIALDIIKNESSENYSFKDIQYISYKKLEKMLTILNLIMVQEVC